MVGKIPVQPASGQDTQDTSRRGVSRPGRIDTHPDKPSAGKPGGGGGRGGGNSGR